MHQIKNSEKDGDNITLRDYLQRHKMKKIRSLENLHHRKRIQPPPQEVFKLHLDDLQRFLTGRIKDPTLIKILQRKFKDLNKYFQLILVKLKNPNCDESIKREELNLKKILGPQKEIIIPEMKKFEIQTSFGASEFGSHINLFTKEKNTPPQISTNFMQSQPPQNTKTITSPKLKKVKSFTDQKMESLIKNQEQQTSIPKIKINFTSKKLNH